MEVDAEASKIQTLVKFAVFLPAGAADKT